MTLLSGLTEDWSLVIHIRGIRVGMATDDVLGVLGEPEVQGQVHGVTHLVYGTTLVRLGQNGRVQTVTGEALSDPREVLARQGQTLQEVVARLGPPTRKDEAKGQAGVLYKSDTLSVLLEFDRDVLKEITLLHPNLGVIWKPA